MAINEDPAAKARRDAAVQTMALVVLLERAGGRVTFSKAEYETAVARHGGARATAIHHEVLAPAGEQPDEVQVTLISKEPGQGDLPV